MKEKGKQGFLSSIERVCVPTVKFIELVGSM